MNTIGLIGGTSWASTIIYYRLLNERVASRLGGLHSASLMLASVDFAPFEALMREGEWTEVGRRLAIEAERLERAGCTAVALCTNTMHKVADAVTAAISIPFIDIREASGAAVREAGCRRPLFLGTRFAMDSDYYAGVLRNGFGLAPIVPSPEDRKTIDRIIFDELCHDIIREPSRRAYLDVIEEGRRAGADSVMLACTEIGLLIGAGDTDLPVFETTSIHVDACLSHMLDAKPLSLEPIR